jgi:nucleoside-diphosphate-sugar epimerase
MKLLVTGASGFIGTSLCHRLVKEDYVVFGAVRRLPKNPVPKVTYRIIENINGYTDWHKTLTEVDSVLHCAARAHIMRETEKDPLTAFRETNVQGTARLAEQARDSGIKRLIFLSSIKVNGENTFDRPFKADDTPAPKDPYGISKWEAEQELKKIGQVTGLQVVVIRSPLVYGPGVQANFLRLMQMVKLGVPLPLGGIQNHRSFVSTDNLEDLIATCLQHPAAANQTFLVSDGEDISTTTLIRKLAKALGNSSHLIPAPEALLCAIARLLGKTDFTQRLLGSLQLDINKTRETLKWSPPVSIDEALQKTAAHFLRN